MHRRPSEETGSQLTAANVSGNITDCLERRFALQMAVMERDDFGPGSGHEGSAELLELCQPHNLVQRFACALEYIDGNLLPWVWSGSPRPPIE